MKNNNTTTNRRRWFRLIGLTVSITTFISLGVVWMIFQHKPSWYHPAIINDLTLQRAQHAFTTFVDDTSHKMVKGKPFSIVLDQKQLNEWLAAMPALFPQARELMPDWLYESAVSISPDMVRIGVLYDKNGWRAIINAGCLLSVSPDGDSIIITLSEAHGGSIPVPQSILKKILSGVIDKSSRQSSSQHRKTQTVDDLFTGFNIENSFIWPNGQRTYRIDSITFHAGTIKLRIDPQRR